MADALTSRPAHWTGASWAERRAQPLKWNPKKEDAAFKMATFVPSREIVDSLGMSAKWLEELRLHPDFRARVQEIRDELNKQVMDLRIADLSERVRILDELQAKYLTLIEERAEEMDGDTAGAGTGLLVMQEKRISLGKGSYTTQVEYKADTAVTSEIMKLQEQAAKELGQRIDRKEIRAQIGIKREFVVVDNSDDPPLTEAELQSLPDPDAIEAEWEELD